MTCPHPDPVSVVVRHPDGAETTVACLCPDCDQQLPANWGCPDCDWEQHEERRLCDLLPNVITTCTRPCEEHQ